MSLDRLRRVTRHEVRWRAATLTRSHAQYVSSLFHQPRWKRADITRVLAPDVIPDAVRAAAAAAAAAVPSRAAPQWQVVHDGLIAHLRSRPSRFVLDPESLADLRREVLTLSPRSADDARLRADRMLAGEYDILGYRSLRFAHDGRRIDWHFDPVYSRRAPQIFYSRVPFLDPAIGDHKIIWELNRHQQWLRFGRAAWLTADPKYARAILDELQSWLDANPPLIGINWASMLEIAFRAISWTWALHCLLAFRDERLGTDPDVGPRESELEPWDWPTPWVVDMFVALARQMTHVEQNLSYYFSPNTHLTGEALALYVVGTALPELAGAQRWAALGRRILLDEIDRQILLDGGHAERSAHYQRYTLDFYLLALRTARLAGDADAESPFASAVGRLAEFTRVLADDRGWLPLLGDDDGGMLWPITGRSCRDVRDSLSVAAVALQRPLLAPWGATEETVWLSGLGAANGLFGVDEVAAATAFGSRALTETGYFVARDRRGGHAVFDTGPHGYLNGGHAHADTLAVVLTLADRPLLIDPGTSTYTMDPLRRDRLRSTMSHNTVTVDGRSHSAPSGPFHWASRADGRIEGWRHSEAFDWAEGAHDGYEGLQHRRAIIRSRLAGWLIADEIQGRGAHTASAHWHFDPDWMLQSEPGRLRALHRDGTVAWLLHDAGGIELFHGDHASGLGWNAPVYGTLMPSPTARVTISGDTPLHLVTWIGEGRDWESPSLLRVPADCDAGGAAIAARVTDGDRRALFMVRMSGAPLDTARTCRVLDYETDARVLQSVVDDDVVLSVDLIDASRLVTRRFGWISIEAEETFGDLHVEIDRRGIDLQTANPPSTLHVRGISRSHRIRLNGRDLPRPDWAGDGLFIHPSEWRTTPQSEPPRLWSVSGVAFARH